MKILMITQIYPQPDDLPGSEGTKTVQYYARDFVKMGNEVVVVHCNARFPVLYYLIPNVFKRELLKRTHIMVPSMSSRHQLRRKDNGVWVYRFPMTKLFPSARYSNRKYNRTMKMIVDELKRIDFYPDVVMGHFANPCCELVRRIGGFFEAKTSIVFHGDCNSHTVEKYDLKKNTSEMGAIGTRSMMDSVFVKKILKLNETPFVCYSGVPDEIVNRCNKVCDRHDFSNGIRFLFVGNLTRAKNVMSVLKAYKKMKTSMDTIPSILEVVGQGEEEKELREEAKKDKQINKEIVFLGVLPREEVFSCMEKSNVFAMISRSEVFGMVWLEAMLMGCLVIATKGGGIDGIIKDGENGFLCEVGNEKELCGIFERISNMTTEQRNCIGQNAIDTAIQYSDTKVAGRYLRDVLERNER